MRLSSQEVSALISEITKYLDPDTPAKLYLFGSRAQDHLKGGDIDLLLILEHESQYQELKTIDYKIVAAIKRNPSIGEQKIDLKIISQKKVLEPFYEQALKTAQLLWRQG